MFLNASEQREVAAGETVFAEGDPGAEMLGLISGVVELRKGEHTLAVLEPGDTFGESRWLTSRPGATAVATEPSVLAVIDDKAFIYLNQSLMFALQVMRSMAQRIRERDPQD